MCAQQISTTVAAMLCAQQAEKTFPVGIHHIAHGWTAMVTASPANHPVVDIDPPNALTWAPTLGNIVSTMQARRSRPPLLATIPIETGLTNPWLSRAS